MKKTILLTAASALLCLFLSSNVLGPASMGLDATEAPGSAGFGCDGCHGAGPGTTTAAAEIRKLSSGPNGPIVTTYIPDTVYTVTIIGNHSTLTHFGFQLTALNTGNTNAGTFSNFPTNTQQSVLNGRNIIEHSDQLPKINNQFEVTFHWKAPSTGSGTVTFYGMLNAVNNNSQVGGDKPSNPINVALTEEPTNVANTQKNISIEAYPNPVTTQLNIKNLEKGNYHIKAYDINGKKVCNKSISVTASETSINTVEWAAGIYHIQLSKEGAQQTIVVMKK